ncbi:MAG: hypothetical protein NXY59_09330 [Aigarchaeota archaeon]|nr:hypothetical protein [Candidatus Pelearchaeum maunauluense]
MDVRRSQARLEEALAKLDAAFAELTRNVSMLFEGAHYIVAARLKGERFGAEVGCVVGEGA